MTLPDEPDDEAVNYKVRLPTIGSLLTASERGLLQRRLWWAMIATTVISTIMLINMTVLLAKASILLGCGLGALTMWFVVMLGRACWMLRRALDPTPRQLRQAAERESARVAQRARIIEEMLRP